MSGWLWVFTSLSLCLPAQEPASEQEPRTADLEEPQGPPAFDHEFGLDEIFLGLGRLVSEYPKLASIETLGRSRLGHELQIVVLTDTSSGATDEKPGLLFVDHRARSGAGYTGGAESVLAFGWSLASRAGSEAEIAALLADHVVYLMPACDPDLRVVEDGASPSPIEFDLNFPLGWQPDSLRAGSGAFPLARPETIGLARFLGSHSNLALIVSVGVPGGESEGPWSGAEFPAADRAALDALCARFADGAGVMLRPWGRLGSPGGGLFDYAYQAQGIYPVSWVGSAAEADEARVAAIARGTIELLEHMPRMRIEPVALREVAPQLWELDVSISNAGVLPTLSALAAQRRVAGDLFLDVVGSKLVATARKQDVDAPFHTARLQPDGEAVDLFGSTLGGGETRWLRLILEAEAGTLVELQGIGTRAGSMRLEVELR